MARPGRAFWKTPPGLQDDPIAVGSLVLARGNHPEVLLP